MGSANPSLFQQKEPDQKTSKSTMLLWQFFLFPLLIVVAALGVFLLFGAFAKDTDTPQEMLEQLSSGGSNRQAQAAHQLAVVVGQEYEAQLADPDRDPPFYAEPSFRRGLVAALDAAIEENESTKRQQLLALMVGTTQAVDGIPLLLEVLYPKTQGRRYEYDARAGAAMGLLKFEGRVAQSALARVATDEKDEEIQAIAMMGLIRIANAAGEEDPLVVRALRKGLDSNRPGIRLQAACGLGVRGLRDQRIENELQVDRVARIIGNALTREGLTQMGIGARFQPGALRNACRAAAVLGDAELRSKVERLTKSDLEGDEDVRRVAREQLKLWGGAQKAKED